MTSQRDDFQSFSMVSDYCPELSTWNHSDQLVVSSTGMPFEFFYISEMLRDATPNSSSEKYNFWYLFSNEGFGEVELSSGSKYRNTQGI